MAKYLLPGRTIWCHGLRRHAIRGKESSGLSLVELLVALAIGTLLIGIAVPSFTEISRRERVRDATSELLLSIHFTRAEAIKRGRRVSMCTSSNQTTCEKGIGWHKGWFVYEDADGNGERENSEPILRVGQATNNGVIVTGNASMRDYVSYLPIGSRQVSTGLGPGALQMGTITACEGATGRAIVINRAGRPRTEQVVCSE